MPSSLKRRILSQRMKWSRRLLLLGPSPQSFLLTRPLSHLIVMDRLLFLPQHLFSLFLPLLPLLCLHHPFRTPLGIFHFLASLLVLSQIPLLFPFLVLLLILIFCLLLLPYFYGQTCLLFILYFNFTFTKFFTSFLLHI